MGEVVNMSMLFTVGGLLVLAGVFTNYPNAIGKPLATPSTATLATWMVFVGGVASTLTYLTGEFTANAVASSEIEDVVANNGGFYLTGAALFYLASIGTILSTMVVIRTGISASGRSLDAEETSDMATYTLTSAPQPRFETSSAEASALTPHWSSPKPKPTKGAPPSSPWIPLCTTMRSRNSLPPLPR